MYRGLGEEYAPMWVDMVAQKGALPTSAITRDAILSLWRNSPGYYATSTPFQPKPGVYNIRADVAMPVNTGGAQEYMPLQVVAAIPVDAVTRDVLNTVNIDQLVAQLSPSAVDQLVAKANLEPVIKRVIESPTVTNLSSGLTTTGTKVAVGTIAVTVGVTLLGAYFLLKRMR